MKVNKNIPQISLGTFQVNDYKIMFNIVKASLENGCLAFDTSPSYGTEKNLGKAIIENKELYSDRKKLFISTKIDGIQMYKSNGNIEKYVKESLRNLQLDYLDLLLIHWPFERYFSNTWNVMSKLYQEGFVKYIGVCNVDKRIISKFIDKNYFGSILPQVIQNEISPLRICDDDIEYFKSLNINVQAYSPLCRMIPPIRESEILKSLSDKYQKDIGQIILRWHIDRGISPVFTSTKPNRIESNLDIFDFCLSHEDILKINGMNQNYKIFLESFGCPGI